MKNYKINLPLFIVILSAFFFLNSFSTINYNEDCVNYLVKSNNDLRHVAGVTNAIINPYQTCVNGLIPQGKRRKYMVDSYVNLIEYYRDNQQNFSYYKKALHNETAK